MGLHQTQIRDKTFEFPWKLAIRPLKSPESRRQLRKTGYASQYGRHVEEGKQAHYNEVELVVSLAGALSAYLLRKRE